MGYRASVITQHREYGSNIFSSWDQFEQYFSYLRGKYEGMDIYSNEEETFFELDKEIVEKEIKRLSRLKPDGKFRFQSVWAGEYPDKNEDIIRAWQAALTESPKDCSYIAMEWF